MAAVEAHGPEKGPILLPGDSIHPAYIPTHPKKPLQLGPGLRHIPPTTIVPTVAGQLITDRKKNSIWIEHNNDGRYIPSQTDLVIGQIHRSTADHYHVHLTPHTPPALLPILSFESATKKTRPQLPPGSLVYARIALANKHMDPELECVSATTGKADGLGPLTGGMVVEVSLGLARRLLMPSSGVSKVVVLEELGGLGVEFEIAVGRNGRVWVGPRAGAKAEDGMKSVLVVVRALRETDEGNLGVEAQKKLARKLVREAI